jgi:hypothetical protein
MFGHQIKEQVFRRSLDHFAPSWEQKHHRTEELGNVDGQARGFGTCDGKSRDIECWMNVVDLWTKKHGPSRFRVHQHTRRFPTMGVTPSDHPF